MKRCRRASRTDGAPGPGVYPKTFAQAARHHARHAARYMLAFEYAAGGNVLDVACGSGYGSSYLARTARHVTGLDIDRQRLQWAREHHQLDNVLYAFHDLHEPLEFDEPFTLAVSFETMEHVDDPAICLANLAASLSEDGVALISVPNGTKELEGRPKPYHRMQFSSRDFESLLRGQFRQVEMYSQVYRKSVSHYVHKLLGSARQARNYRFTNGLLGEAKTWLAVCRQPIR